jgi:transcriptional regulator with XRE-family HTH domain
VENVDEIIEALVQNKTVRVLQRLDLSNSKVSLAALKKLREIKPGPDFIRQAVFNPNYQNHRWYANFLNSYDIPKELRSVISVPPFYASGLVPELRFLWLRYFAALDYDRPDKRTEANQKYHQALKLLETNHKEGSAKLWENAWTDGNHAAYLKLQELFQEHKPWCKVLSHFPASESEMIDKIKKAREALEFFYGSADGSEKLSLETPHISIAFARFEEARLLNALENNGSEVENSIRHILQGVHIHYRRQWTQEKIGDKFGVSQSSVSSFLRGNSCPKLVQNVCTYYEENPDSYFFEPRKRGWSFSFNLSLSSFLPWASSKPKRDEEAKRRVTEEEQPLIKGLLEKKAE